MCLAFLSDVCSLRGEAWMVVIPVFVKSATTAASLSSVKAVNGEKRILIKSALRDKSEEIFFTFHLKSLKYG